MIQIDMDMPKSCFDCDKTRQWKNTGKVQCPHISMPSISMNTTKRPSYCPLKEVSDNTVLQEELGRVEKSFDNILDNIVAANKMKEELKELLPSEMLSGNIFVEAFEKRPNIYYESEKSGTKCFRSVDEVVEFVNKEFKKEEESRK